MTPSLKLLLLAGLMLLPACSTAHSLFDVYFVTPKPPVQLEGHVSQESGQTNSATKTHL